ncbi:MAG: ABC transporter ATP-binding protein, partial [Coprobacillaceae bacterium]
MKKIILSTKGLCKSFAQNGEQTHVLNMLDIEIYQGDFTIIMGSSGSGKSTLLYALSGMDKATAGEVLYKNENIVIYSEKQLAKLRHQDFGFVFQQMHLVSNLNVIENVVVPGYLNKEVSANDTNKRAHQLLKQMGLSHALRRLPSQISGGEQQ